MTKPEITGWVSSLDAIYERIAATRAIRPDEAGACLEDALAAIEALHAQMLRAEVRAVVAARWVDGQRG